VRARSTDGPGPPVVAARSGDSATPMNPRRERGSRARTAMPGAQVRATRESLALSQRSRLVRALIELSVASGSRQVSIQALCARAGVSAATFNENFQDKEDVLVAAYRASAEGILGQMDSAVAHGERSDVARLALGALLAAVARDPDAGRMLFLEPMSGGARVLEERTLAERRAQELFQRSSDGSITLDIPAIAVVGALRHIVSRHLLAYAEDELPSRLGHVLAWLLAYSRAPAPRLWSTSPAALVERAPQPPPPAWTPQTLPRGSHGLSPSAIVRSQRKRLIDAAAEAMMAKGYAGTTIKDIVTTARVTSPVFYQHFSGKEQIFLQAQERSVQRILGRCARAYFSVRDWPERLWKCLATLLKIIVENRATSHLLVVDSYAAGPQAIRRAEEITRSFTLFLDEGAHDADRSAALETRPQSRWFSRASVGAIFEIIQRLVAAGEWGELPRRLPQLA
jgi:AcrR family transcriptional regulator